MDCWRKFERVGNCYIGKDVVGVAMSDNGKRGLEPGFCDLISEYKIQMAY